MTLSSGTGALLVWGSLVACASLSETSPLPNGDASDIDTGFLPPPPDDASSAVPPTPDAGPPPPSGRVRLANLLRGAGPVDLCVKGEAAAAPWEPAKISENPNAPKPGGLNYGEISAHVFLSVPGSSGSRFQFRVVQLGAPCEGTGVTGIVTIAAGTSTLLRQGGGLTVIAVGVADGSDAGDANPKGVSIADNLTPPASSAQVRIFHGAPELSAFDLVINGETTLTGIRYGSAIGFPYSSTTGFASIAAGVPEGSTLTLRAGATFRSYTVPTRIRRGTAMTAFVTGLVGSSSDPLSVALCADRSPPEGASLAACTALTPIR